MPGQEPVTIPLQLDALGRPVATVVSVVVVTYNPGRSLDACLRSLRHALDVPYEVMIVDNGSVDGAPERAAARHRARLIHVGRNAGYGTAANIGVAESEAPWVLVINPDTEFLPGSLSRLLDATRRWPGAGVFGPALLNDDGTVYPSARSIPSLTAGIGHALCVRWWPSNPWTAAYRREGQLPVEGPTGWLSGACLMFSAAAFASVGGFDERYFMYFEDLDLCERLATAGWSNVYVPSAAVHHVGGLATAQVPATMTLAHHRSAVRYLTGRYPKVRHAPLRWALRVGLGVRGWLLTRQLSDARVSAEQGSQAAASGSVPGQVPMAGAAAAAVTARLQPTNIVTAVAPDVVDLREDGDRLVDLAGAELAHSDDPGWEFGRPDVVDLTVLDVRDLVRDRPDPHRP
jgi:N-acetylglucosaminyl-diphospho-decaprenol L-rhamnosyltransferase